MPRHKSPLKHSIFEHGNYQPYQSNCNYSLVPCGSLPAPELHRDVEEAPPRKDLPCSDSSWREPLQSSTQFQTSSAVRSHSTTSTSSLACLWSGADSQADCKPCNSQNWWWMLARHFPAHWHRAGNMTERRDDVLHIDLRGVSNDVRKVDTTLLHPWSKPVHWTRMNALLVNIKHTLFLSYLFRRWILRCMTLWSLCW